jgi:DNA-binding transcriptional LysR family regulator
MSLDLEHLETFLAVSRHGGMRRAAAALHLTQPAISARIHELEAGLGAPLFERIGRRLHPTAAGRLLAAEAPALLAAALDLRRRVEAASGSERGALRLATIDAASIYVLPPVYLEFRRAHPSIQLTVQVVDSRRVAAALLDLDADVGVLALPTEHPDLTVTPIWEDRMVCVAAPGHGFAAGPPVRLAELARQPLVLYGRGSVTRALLDEVFARRGLEPHVAMETASPEAMKRLAEVGVGIAIVPEALVRHEVASGRLQALAVRDARFERRLGVAVRRARPLPDAALRFLEILDRHHPALAGGPRHAATPKTRGAHRSR